MIKRLFYLFLIWLTIFIGLVIAGARKGEVFNVSFYPEEALFWLLVAELGLEFVFLMLQKVVQMLKNDVLISNHDFSLQKETVDTLSGAEKNKIVLTRNQFDEAAILIVKTISATSTGLLNEARRHLVCLRKIIGDDAIIDILMLKIYKKEKNFDKMEQLSQKLMQNENIQLVGMKAAVEAQMEKKEFTEALKTVNHAFEVRQDLYWVLSSAFILRAKNNDWVGALEVLDAGISKNIIPEHKASRLKAVALYELAKQAKKENDDVKFFKFVTQAMQENSRLIPAALDLAAYYVKNDAQIRKAEKVLCAIWAENPSYDVAMAYLNLFDKDSAEERVQRMEKLALINTKRPSLNNLILAQLYIDAKKYAKARTECNLFLLKNPATQKIAEMLDILEEDNPKDGKSGNGFMDSLKSHIPFIKNEETLYPKDFQWVCANCGHTSDEWQAICPECGEVGRHYWNLYIDKNAKNTEETD